MSAIYKVTSGELLTKQAMRKQILLYTKNMYILKLLLNVVTAGIGALVLGNNFCTPVSKKRAQLHFDTFHQLLITVEAVISTSSSHKCTDGSHLERDQG
jgi:hypothetical protein